MRAGGVWPRNRLEIPGGRKVLDDVQAAFFDQRMKRPRTSKDQTVLRCDYLIPIAIECGPTRCSTRVAEKPASRIQA